MLGFRNLFVTEKKMLSFVFAPITLFLTTAVYSDEISRLGQDVLDARNLIRSVRADVEVVRTLPQKIASNYYVVFQDDHFRIDRERVTFSIDKSEEGSVSRSAAVGTEVRKNHSTYGAELNLLESDVDFHVDLRVLGLSTSPFANITRDKHSVDQSIVARVLANTDRIEEKEIEGVRCIVATHDRGPGSELSFFCEAESGRYRGCGAVSSGVTAVCWIEESKLISGIDFPVKIICRDVVDGILRFEEEVSLANVEINIPIPDEEFEFSGLGVEPGETVRIKEMDGRPDVREMYWDGTQLVDSQLEITREFWTLPRTLGVALIVLGVVVGLSIAGRKWAAARR
jgi:hypothetical protein